MTEQEFIYVLEYCANEGKISCEYCPLYKENNCLITVSRESLNHIKQLKAENENYSHNNKKLTADHIKLLKKIKRMQSKIEQLNNNISAMAITMSNSAKATRNDAIKEFVEILKENSQYIFGYGYGISTNRIAYLADKKVGEQE